MIFTTHTFNTPYKATHLYIYLPADIDPAALKGTAGGTIDFLFLIFHGGSTLVSQMDKVNKTIDFKTLQNHFHDVTDLHYHSAIRRVALRLVPCPSVCNTAHKTLCQVMVVNIGY